MVLSETLPLAEIKARLSEIVDKVEEQHERVTLTRNGRPAAVLISPEDLAVTQMLNAFQREGRAILEQLLPSLHQPKGCSDAMVEGYVRAFEKVLAS